MIILALDTSSECGSVAMASDGTLRGEVRLPGALQHSETLFRSIDFLLTSLGTAIGEVDLFAAARGPGSYTGLRVGMAAAEGLAYATGAETVGVSTLAALAWQVGATEGSVAAVMDARRGEIYVGLFRRLNGGLETLAAPRIDQPDAVLDSLGEEQVVFTGPGVKHFGPRIHECESWTLAEAEPWLASRVAEMVGRGYAEPFSPVYLRPAGTAPASPAPHRSA